MQHCLIFFILILFSYRPSAQQQGDPRFPKAALEADLQFIQTELFHAHANPFTELDSFAYTRLFEAARANLRDSMTAFEFARLAKPLVAPLSDEHAKIGLSMENSVLKDAPIFLPFSIKKQGAVLLVDRVLPVAPDLHSGDTLMAIEGVRMAEIIERCAALTTGFPEQRRAKAIAQLGSIYVFAYPVDSAYTLACSRGPVRVTGVAYQTLNDFLRQQNKDTPCSEPISYQRSGRVGYINFCSFNIRSDSAFQQLESNMEAIFRQVRRDKIDTLLVDVSQNSGGNSQCGNLMINYLYAKPYRGYSCKWKRSDEYLALLAEWKIAAGDSYKNMPAGSVLASGPYTTRPARRLKNRFKGKAYVVVGNNTFSSAIMFATIVKDNHIATLIGQEPANGHPNHFGEMYGSTTPNAKLKLQFGVKEWIRPSGERQENHLVPDVVVDLDRVGAWEELVPLLRR